MKILSIWFNFVLLVKLISFLLIQEKRHQGWNLYGSRIPEKALSLLIFRQPCVGTTMEHLFDNLINESNADLRRLGNYKNLQSCPCLRLGNVCWLARKVYHLRRHTTDQRIGGVILWFRTTHLSYMRDMNVLRQMLQWPISAWPLYNTANSFRKYSHFSWMFISYTSADTCNATVQSA